MAWSPRPRAGWIASQGLCSLCSRPMDAAASCSQPRAGDVESPCTELASPRIAARGVTREPHRRIWNREASAAQPCLTKTFSCSPEFKPDLQSECQEASQGVIMDKEWRKLFVA